MSNPSALLNISDFTIRHSWILPSFDHSLKKPPPGAETSKMRDVLREKGFPKQTFIWSVLDFRSYRVSKVIDSACEISFSFFLHVFHVFFGSAWEFPCISYGIICVFRSIFSVTRICQKVGLVFIFAITFSYSFALNDSPLRRCPELLSRPANNWSHMTFCSY